MFIIHANRISIYVFSVTDIYLALMQFSNIWKQTINSVCTNKTNIFLKGNIQSGNKLSAINEKLLADTYLSFATTI